VADAGALDHDEVLVDHTVMREATLKQAAINRTIVVELVRQIVLKRSKFIMLRG
jgi:hypothetical protein